jgi:ribosomal protein S18 acetylase RimI-like enzyme
MQDNDRGRRFVERLGFQKVGEEKGIVGYELRQLRF